MSIETKICSVCKEEKTIDEYYKRKDAKDGLRNTCKKCRKMCNKLYYSDNKERVKQLHKQYYNNNIDTITRYNKQYYSDNKERVKQLHKRWRENKPEYNKQYRESIAKYKTYSDILNLYEDTKLADDGISLLIKCKLCNNWFSPSNTEVRNRINAINGNIVSLGIENNFYCSERCKNMCSLYGMRFNSSIYDIDDQRPLQSSLRAVVLERDNFICQACGAIERLVCHHIDPVKNNPIESADADNCVTLCIDCHKEAHQKDGCGYGELRKCQTEIT